jgi:hypothetical protein
MLPYTCRPSLDASTSTKEKLITRGLKLVDIKQRKDTKLISTLYYVCRRTWSAGMRKHKCSSTVILLESICIHLHFKVIHCVYQAVTLTTSLYPIIY